MQTVLAKIVADKAIWVQARKQQQPLASFQNEIVPTQRNFYDALAGTRTAFILECKKASPSKGLIREDFDPAAIASIYKHYASAISVLCDEKYFQGSFDFLPIVSQVAPQPILCKDFTIDPYQIYLARYYQADACLLMLSVLDDEQYRQLSAVAHSLNMGVLTEVSNEEELERAIALKAKVVGINNRDLRDMSIDLNRTRQLAARLGPDVTVISESGIHTYAEVRELSHFANGFLIGSALMEQADLETAVKRVLLSLDRDLDSRIELEMRTDHKELSEHLMLVDLARNDLARICTPGSRYVADLTKVDRYSFVMHLVSRVVGELRQDLDDHSAQSSRCSSCSSGYCSRSLASVSVRRGAISCGLQTGIRSSSSRR